MYLMTFLNNWCKSSAIYGDSVHVRYSIHVTESINIKQMNSNFDTLVQIDDSSM